jgi:hypothetical protein
MAEGDACWVLIRNVSPEYTAIGVEAPGDATYPRSRSRHSVRAAGLAINLRSAAMQRSVIN